ncbi:hypothetical protein [Mangrovimonas sp. YM274]|uniref:hypothetical protein n=1 Tax=Mangrovimonas sp. YM274 TaxID=3070660 RepID=UPI0027DD0537|nr:hypothetical protein [Mangrovimonas sp. YM274]WMI68237.1 hypothetical protein RBH95_13940 [Mangrovimonas sp. YM274]
MRYDKIDIPKSKQKGRVIRNTGLIEPIFDYFTYTISTGIFPFISGIFFFDQLEKGESLFGASILFGLSIILSGLLLYSIINIDRLKRINGILKNNNQQAIKNLTEKLGWTLQIHNQKVSILSPPGNWFSINWTKQIVVIYDRQDILINSTSYGGLNEMKSHMDWFGNRKLEKVLKNYFEYEIKKTTRQHSV